MKHQVAVLFFIVVFISCSQLCFSQNDITGAWKTEEETDKVLIVNPGYFSVTEYDKNNKQFMYSWGGRWEGESDQLKTTVEFHTEDKAAVDKQLSFVIKADNDVLTTDITGESSEWQKLDDGKGILAGTWRITGREENSTMNTLNRGARKTIKILSGTRFQWAAINTETGEFFGTGGGTYSFQDSIYTEHIEFFSRDSSRVGMSLSFKGDVQGNNWHHSGKSSKGDPINEIWSREN